MMTLGGAGMPAAGLGAAESRSVDRTPGGTRRESALAVPVRSPRRRARQAQLPERPVIEWPVA